MNRYKEYEDILNSYDDWLLSNDSDDGRVNSLMSEKGIVESIVERLGLTKTKEGNRDDNDLYIKEGEDLKIVLPNNFTNTISFLKLAKMLNLEGDNYNTIGHSYEKQKNNNEIKLVDDYVIVFLNKKTKKFTICSLTELPIECITVNPSNGVQTKIPTYLVSRTVDEKFELVHSLLKGYINKRILIPSKIWGPLLNGE
jgi:replication fork clamp-binding protein CrfC